MAKSTPPNTLREIIVCIQTFLHENNLMWKLIDGVEFVRLRNVLDNVMKQRHSLGYGVRQSAEIISLAHEDVLFGSGVVGLDSPQKLLNGIIYLLGLHAALRGGVEHNNLRRPGHNCQFSIERDSRGVEVLVYREDPLQKTNQGGLQCKVKPKVVKICAASNLDRDPITYFKKYIALLPQGTNCKKLYLRPRKVPHPCVWYCDQAYRVNKVKSTIKDICKQAGLDGKFSNHSLRATCATRMYDNKIPEQIIKETTGHCSECVRGYKRTSDELKESASNALCKHSEGWAPTSKIPKLDIQQCNLDHGDLFDIGENEKPIKKNVKVEDKIPNDVKSKYKMSYLDMLHNVLKSRIELQKKMFPKSRLSLRKYKSLVARRLQWMSILMSENRFNYLLLWKSP